MPIYCTNFYTQNMASLPVYTNTLIGSNMSDLTIGSNLRVEGNLSTKGHIDTSTRVYGRLGMTSDAYFTQNEIFATSNSFALDASNTNMAPMNDMNVVVPIAEMYNRTTGEIAVPVSGLYALEMQGIFTNDPSAKGVAENGVYFYVRNGESPSVRVAANTTTGSIVSTAHINYLTGGSIVQPTFFSSDSNAQLIAAETYVTFALIATTST